MTDGIETLGDMVCLLGEGPLWDPREQALYWTDIEGHRIHRRDPTSGEGQSFEMPCEVGCIALRQRGGFVLATRWGFALWQPGGPLEYIGDPEADKPDARFNDGAVDRAGRFWAGTYGQSYDSALYRLDPDRTITRMVSGVDIANGIGWDPANRILYFTDSTPRQIYAFDFDLASGTIENRRVFVDSSDEPGVPDGLAVDRDGFVWSVRWGGWCIQRYDPAGKLERVIRLPVEFPTSCAFGGEALDELFVTSASSPVKKGNPAHQPFAGRVLRLDPGARGLLEPEFLG